MELAELEKKLKVAKRYLSGTESSMDNESMDGNPSPRTDTFLEKEWTATKLEIEELEKKLKESKLGLTEDTKVPEQELVALGMFGDKIRLVVLKPDGNYSFLDDAQNSRGIFYVSSKTFQMELAIEELEYLVNNLSSKEKRGQVRV